MKTASHLNSDLILVFDAGTQSVRCALFDTAGTLVDMIKIPIEPYFVPAPGFHEQHPEYFWQKFCEASQGLLARNESLREHIKAVTLTTQRGVYVNLDRDGKPLRPAIHWLDQRMADTSKFAPFWLEYGLKAIGLYGVVDTLNRKCFSNWIRQHQPDVWEKTHKYVLLSGFFHYQLTGVAAESRGSNFGYIPINRKDFGWAKKNDIIWYAFPMEKDKLPDLVVQGETIGKVTKQASLETGIPEGIPLAAGSCDKSCEVLGSGTLTPDIGYLSFGTCATVNAVSTKSVDLLPYLPPYPGAVPGTYCTEIPIDRGFWLVSWFKEQFGHQEVQLAAERGVSPEALFEEMIQDIPPGSNGLMLQPYWSPDRVYCDEYGKGAVIGFSDRHTRAHLYRAVLEGIIFALKDGAKITTDKLGRPFTKLRVSGGGSQSRTALQITADVFNLPVEVPSVNETGMLGAAMNAAVGLGYYSNYEAAVAGMTSIREVIHPIPRNRDLYEQLYNRIYRKMYSQLKPLYKDLADITSDFQELVPTDHGR
ncbi:FGGY-family carbohydrate kinase [Candidatus Villigracilis saccharophilus]|uniref:FGGY-family carbohydrate kinase n=1 Tax=Candidatus Villigracilis saccharophilus TaxID=3140684 RepID=UPI003134E7E4|nr:FGGY-family carbohydrate kinase [Anaerolineales bacterium]